MTLKTDAALDALHAALEDAAGVTLPECTRNDDVMKRFADAGGGFKWRLHMLDGVIRPGAGYVGGGWEVQVLADITVAIEGESGADRDAKLQGALETLTGVLFPTEAGLIVDGAFDGLDLVGDIVPKRIPPDDGRKPIRAWEFTVALQITAPTPFG